MSAAELLDYHNRRLQRIEEAWLSSGGDVEEAWTLLRFLGPTVSDGESTLLLIRSDVEVQDVPSSCDSFTAHYNRILTQRVELFEGQYSVGGLLGQGGFSRVLRAAHVVSCPLEPLQILLPDARLRLVFT